MILVQIFPRARTLELNRLKITNPSVGTLERLIVGHDGSGASSGWFLDNVTVECAGSNIIFPCERYR